MFLRSGYNYDRDVVSLETGLDTGVDGGAKQSFRDECDINTIVRRFGLSGQLPENVRMPTHGDFVDALDFQASMNALVAARESFQAMPADVRARFHNDPGEFVDFCSNAANRDEAKKLGLLVPDPVVVSAVVPVPVVAT